MRNLVLTVLVILSSNPTRRISLKKADSKGGLNFPEKRDI
jgi:hypothetical protein